MSSYRDKHLEALREGGWIGADADPSELPDSAAENRAWRLIAGLLLLLAATLAAVYAYLASPAAANLDLRALGRLVAVRRFYASPPAELQGRQLVIALGDSITVGSLDCQLLDELLGPEPVCFNLATPGKCLPEYLLDLQEPMLQGATVVVLANPGAIYARQAVQLDQRRANMIRVLDYPLDRSAWNEYAGLVPDSGIDQLLRPRFFHIWESRWRVEESLGTWLQQRSPLTKPEVKQLLRYQREVYARNLKRAELPLVTSPEERRAALADRAGKDPALYQPDYDPAPDALAAWDFVLDRLSSRAGQVLLVLAPLHPLQQDYLGPEGLARFRGLMAAHASGRLKLLDLSLLLDDTGFRDEIHPGPAGTEAITRAVAAALLDSAELPPGQPADKP